MPDQWVSELAAAVRYETIADDAAPQTQRPAGGYLGGLPGEDGTQRPVTTRAATAQPSRSRHPQPRRRVSRGPNHRRRLAVFGVPATIVARRVSLALA
jgi:hypothetical protein